jgi:hypothetical protein
MRLDRGAARDVLTAKIDMGGYYAQTRRDGHRGAGFRRSPSARERSAAKRFASASPVGVEMRQVVDLAIDERNGVGGLLGGKVVAEIIDDQARGLRREGRQHIAAVIYVNDVDCDRFREIDGER